MKRSESVNELAAALSKAQRAFVAAERTHTATVQTKAGGQYSFAYADLAAYLDICRAPLADNGLSIVQEPSVNGDKVQVTTMLLHQSGQWIESDPLPLKMIADSRGEFTAQIVGSAITYARRYSLASLVGMASESEDDDANHASGNRAEIGKRDLPPCPQCGNNVNVIKGREEFGGGWLCWNKSDRGKHGCGHKWQDAQSSETNGYPATPVPAKITLDEAQELANEFGSVLQHRPGNDDWKKFFDYYQVKKLGELEAGNLNDAKIRIRAGTFGKFMPAEPMKPPADDPFGKWKKWLEDIKPGAGLLNDNLAALAELSENYRTSIKGLVSDYCKAAGMEFDFLAGRVKESPVHVAQFSSSLD